MLTSFAASSPLSPHTHHPNTHTQTYEETHTHAISTHYLRYELRSCLPWKKSPVEQYQRDKQNLGTAHTALPRSCAEGVLLVTGSCHFAARDLSTAFLEISPWHPAAPGSYVLQYGLHSRGVPFTEGEVIRSLRRSKDFPAKMQFLNRA